MRRFGDDHHQCFASSVAQRQQMGPTPDAGEALSMLGAFGHATVSETELIALRSDGAATPPFCRLTMLAWRAIDDAQDRFAQALCVGDRQGLDHAVEVAAAHLALIDTLAGEQATKSAL